MRPPSRVPIRRIIRGTDHYGRKPLEQLDYPISPSIENLLSRPTWSVRSLLPPTAAATAAASSSGSPNTATRMMSADQKEEEEVTPAKLHHLLRLSALPLPKSPGEEAKMLQTLRNQVHFVRAVQSVDTTGVEPLITIRDETQEAIDEQTVTLEKMIPYLELEEKVGPNGTVRRRDVVRTEEDDRRERAMWEVDVGDLGSGSERRRKGRLFYVKKEKQGKKDDVRADKQTSTLERDGDPI